MYSNLFLNFKRIYFPFLHYKLKNILENYEFIRINLRLYVNLMQVIHEFLYDITKADGLKKTSVFINSTFQRLVH